MTLVYLAAHVFGDVHWLYFMVDLLALRPVYDRAGAV